MRLAVASGKGGTGKTTVAVNLALSAGAMQLIDCDVEAPNAAIFLGVEPREIEEVTQQVPVVDADGCDGCGECARFCRYNALAALTDDVLVFPELCRGCGGCALVCPRDAITYDQRRLGAIESAASGEITFYRGLLEVGAALAVPVIRALKRRIDPARDAILDAPPGSACPVLETVEGGDYCLLVTEPTPFGLHDLKLAVAAIRSLDVPCGVVINRDGSGDDRVARWCEVEGLPVLLRIPDDRRIAELYADGHTFADALEGWSARFRAMLARIRSEVEA